MPDRQGWALSGLFLCLNMSVSFNGVILMRGSSSRLGGESISVPIGVAKAFRTYAKDRLAACGVKFKDSEGTPMVRPQMGTAYGRVGVLLGSHHAVFMLLDFPHHKDKWCGFDSWKHVFDVRDHVKQSEGEWSAAVVSSFDEMLSRFFALPDESYLDDLSSVQPSSVRPFMWLSCDHIPYPSSDLCGRELLASEGGVFSLEELETSYMSDSLPNWLCPLFMAAKKYECVSVVFDLDAPVDARFPSFN